MATAKTNTDSDQENFFRMSILIVDYALKVVQDVLQKELRKKYPNLFDPNTGLLNKVLGDATVRATLFGLSPKVFNHHQRKQLYPAGNPSTSVTVGDLDLTLTVLLLRNITSLNPRPQFNAWDNPSDTDTSTEATIGRVKRYRNTVYGHANKAAISGQDFSTHFSGLKSNLLALSSRFTNEDYDAILSEPLDADLLKKYQGIMAEWSDYDKDVDDKMEAGFKRVSEGITQLLDGQSELRKLCLGQDKRVHTTKVASNPQHSPSLMGVVSQVMETQHLSPPLSTEEEITQTKCTESTATNGDVGHSAGTKLQTGKSDTCYQTPVMSPTHKNLLVKMRPLLVENLRVEDFIRDMVAMNIFTKDIAGKVMAEETIESQANKFLCILPECGPRAFETFVEVLRKHNKKELADSLAEKATACSGKNQIASFYIKYMSEIQRLPWDPDDTMHIDDVYVNLQWLQEERKPSRSSSVPIQSYTSIFKDTEQGKPPKRILVRGKAGIGKTTFTQKMATDWANTTLGLGKCNEVLAKFEHLLILNLRSIQPGQTLKEAIEAQISCSAQNRKAVTDEVMQALDFDTDHVLLVFDGYDEYDINTSKEITDIIYRRRYQDVCTVVTTRPWKAEKLNRRIMDSVCEIIGLREENIAEYVAKFFNDEQTYDEYLELKSVYLKSLNFLGYQKKLGSIGNGLVGYIEEKKLMSLVRIPILLLFVCLMWKQDQESDAKTKSLPASYSLLYSKLIQFLLRRRYDIRTQDETEELIRKSEETFISLGKLAYDGLVKPDGGLKFNEKDLQRIPDISELYSLGLLNKSKIHSNLDVKHEVTFPHKTIQEFFAAKYLARTLDKSDSITLDLFLEKFDTLDKLYDMDFVLRFLCGLSRRATAKVLSKAKSFQGEFLKENYEAFKVPVSYEISNRYILVNRLNEWCSDLLLEHWYAHCPQETVLPPELISWHKALCIRGSFHHSDPKLQQVLYDSVESLMCSPQIYSGIFKCVNAVFVNHCSSVTDRWETQHKLLSLLSKCDVFEELLEVYWGRGIHTCGDCTCALNNILSKAPNLQTLILDINCGALFSIPNPGKLLNLDVHDIDSQVTPVIKQMRHLKYIRVKGRSLPPLGTLPNTSHDLTHIDINGQLQPLCVQLLGRNLHHVRGLKYLTLMRVFNYKTFCGSNWCLCPWGEDTSTKQYQTCQDVCKAVRELSQGVIHTTKLTHFLFWGNNLGTYNGITSPLKALIQSLSTVSEHTGMWIDMGNNILGRVDRLSELIEAIVRSYQYVSYWDLRSNFLEESLPQPDGSLKCEVCLDA